MLRYSGEGIDACNCDLGAQLVVGGCLTDEQIIAERGVKDDQKCQSYGARPGTDAYVNCRANWTARARWREPLTAQLQARRLSSILSP